MDSDWTLEERPKRHKGAYKPELKDIPFELSRGKIETFIKCPRCFFMEKFQGIKPPGIPGFLLNTNTDTLLKKDHDQYRGKEPHPLMVKAGLEHLIPFEHEDLGKWEQSTQFGATPNHFNTWHRESNILFGGGLDDVWVELVRPREVLGRDDAPKGTGKLHIVDYKSTSQGSTDPNKIKPLDESFIAPLPKDSKYPDYKASIRRQMDMYQWIMRRKGYEVSDTGYFLFVDGLHNGIDGMLDKNDPATAWMKFNAAIIPYEGDASWVDDALMEIRELLDGKRKAPHVHSEGCDLGRFLNESEKAP